MSEPTFNTWGLGESPISIEYSLVVLEEVRHEVNQGLQRIARGGIEVGGALYGTCDGSKVRVEAMRPVACSHSHGPAFILSEDDRAGLAQQLEEDLQDPHLLGLDCVGWFVSHNRGDMVLTDQDVKLFTDFFPDPLQVTLLVRPGRGSGTKAAFFVKEADGSVQADHPHMEFDFPDRLAGVLDRVPKKERQAETRKGFRELPPLGAGPVAVPPRGPQAVPPLAAPGENFSFGASLGGRYGSMMEGQRPMPSPERKSSWLKNLILVMGAALSLAAIGGGYLYWSGYFVAQKSQAIALSMSDQGGQLQIEWNPFARPVATALKGDLEIVDGGQAQVIPLVVADLEKGHYTYTRKSGDVEVRLTVRGVTGTPSSEASRFLGQAPTAVIPPPVEAASQEPVAGNKSDLEAEIERLKTVNANQTKRIQQLQTNLAILQTRLGIQQNTDPPQ